MRVFEIEEKEMDLYRKYASHYGYVFYISKKDDAKLQRN